MSDDRLQVIGGFARYQFIVGMLVRFANKDILAPRMPPNKAVAPFGNATRDQRYILKSCGQQPVGHSRIVCNIKACGF
jgi:hypothetical protein